MVNAGCVLLASLRDWPARWLVVKVDQEPIPDTSWGGLCAQVVPMSWACQRVEARDASWRRDGIRS